MLFSFTDLFFSTFKDQTLSVWGRLSRSQGLHISGLSNGLRSIDQCWLYFERRNFTTCKLKPIGGPRSTRALRLCIVIVHYCCAQCTLHWCCACALISCQKLMDTFWNWIDTWVKYQGKCIYDIIWNMCHIILSTFVCKSTYVFAQNINRKSIGVLEYYALKWNGNC